MVVLPELAPADAAVFETFVVPRYLARFGEVALELLLVGEGARVAHLGCRTGYPNQQLLERGAAVVGVESSAAALELARSQAATWGEVALEYVDGDLLPTPLEDEGWSNVLCLHPLLPTSRLDELARELWRLLYPGGQALLALPLRGSFREVADLLREYALKYDDTALGDRVDSITAARPSVETVTELFEDCGFTDVDVELRSAELEFDSGRAFVADPVARLLLLPMLALELELDELGPQIDYLRDAIDRYWSEARFGLSLQIGCVSARKG